MGDCYAYALTCEDPNKSFSAVRDGIYNAVEHQMVTELVIDLLEF